ncbi:FmdB family zinc ribbon protein [Actinokineospora globicatena]|uniref:FmdB family zinc ribbon protein n=1 Tax=Actinokineospora globicatena TaxID=103729 RepID=UPI0020A59A32|nr:FmdB family zinc ribbon protein [Actinokineospora globicatena]MCP2300677.1 putative regulatory protein, FmdB family [Actinokineospora globicatena]
MPTYQYACTACEHRFEAVQSFTDAALSECPECTGRLRKLYGSVGVVFKGSGFYRNDSRSGSSSGSTAPAAKTETAAKSESTKTESTAKTESKSDTSSGSKPAAKSDSTAAKAS